MSNWKRRYLIIFSSIIVLTTLYQIYKIDIYQWLCDAEGTMAACTVAGLQFEEEGLNQSALMYFKKSCHKKYAIGCLNAARLEQDEKEKLMLNAKACQINPELKQCPKKEGGEPPPN